MLSARIADSHGTGAFIALTSVSCTRQFVAQAPGAVCRRRDISQRSASDAESDVQGKGPALHRQTLIGHGFLADRPCWMAYCRSVRASPMRSFFLRRAR